MSDLYYFSKTDLGSSSYLEPNYKYISNFSVGVAFEPKQFPISLELLYLELGAKHNLLDDGIEGDVLAWVAEDLVLSMNYLSTIAHYNLDIGDKYSLLVGPQINYLIKSKKEGAPGSEIYIQNSFRVENKLDFGLNIKLNYALTKSVNFGISAYNGFGTVERPVRNSSGARNRYFALGLTCKLYQFKSI